MIAAVSGLILGAVPFAFAQTTAAPAASDAAAAPAGPSKIAVIAFQAAVGKTNEFQRSFIDIQKKWEPKQQQLKTEGDAIDSETKQLQSQSSTLSQADQATRGKAIEEKRKNFERSFQDARDGYQQEVQTLYNNTATKVYDVLADYAQKNGFTLVLDIATQQSPVMYAVETTDITTPVLDAYNVKSGVPAPPQTAAVPPSVTRPAARPAVPKQ